MIRFWVRHPVTTWMLFSALMVAGVYALPRLNIESMPETELPSLSINTRWNGASPTAVQRSITIPIEEAAQRIHGVEKITARSAPGRSEVEVSFRRGTDLEFARLELSEQLGAVRRNLPASADQPAIVPFIPEEFRTDDFFTVSLVSPLSPNELRDGAQTWLVPRFLSIPGVADAELQGGARPLVKVLLDLDLMERFGLTADGVFERLWNLDAIRPAGAVRRSGREFSVSIQDSVTIDLLRRTVLTTVAGQSVTLSHVAGVERAYEDPSYFVRINGENVIQATIAKRSGQNAVKVSRALRDRLPEIQDGAPFPVTFEIDEDQGRELEDKLLELVYRSLIILGLLFVFLALALKRVRLTSIVVASVLLAILICLSLFYFLGISVNFITISGLTVCFGMLLDNSILVLDSVHRRLTKRNGAGATSALVDGTREAAFPILATTLTTIVAFLSFIFLSGRLSLYYVPLAVSIGIAMLASIFVAFCWMPVALRGTAVKETQRSAAGAPPRLEGRKLLVRWTVSVLGLAALACVAFAVIKDFGTLLEHWPWAVGIAALLLLVGIFVSFAERITAFHLRFWWYPILLTLVLFAGGWHVFEHKIHKGGFWRQGDEEQLRAYIERPVGTDVVLSSETMKLFEDEILPLPEGVHLKSWSWENRAFMQVEFEPEMLRTQYPELFRNKLILLAEEMGGMFIWLAGFGDPYLKGGRGGGLSNSLIRVTGYNSKVLDELSAGVMAGLDRNRRVRNVRLASGERFESAAADETVILIRRDKLVEHGLSVGEVMGYLRRLLGIETPWRMIVEGEDRRLQLSFADAEDIQYEQVMSKTMTTPSGQRVHLAELVTLETRPVVGSIHRENQRYSMQINWEYVGTDRMRQSFIQEVLAGMELSYGYTAQDVSGERMTQEEEEQVETMLWLTVLFVFMTLAALFESIALPLLVLLSIPMAMTGVVALFWATDSAFDSSAKIGLVLLFGIVVNNCILLVNRFRLQIREVAAERDGAPGMIPTKPRLGAWDLRRLPSPERKAILKEAITTGTRIQLRSILLTSGTTVAGLIPLLIRITDATEGKDIWENLALSSIGGLVSSTVLILCAVPAFYWIASRVGWESARLRRRVRQRAAPESPPLSAGTDPA